MLPVGIVRRVGTQKSSVLSRQPLPYTSMINVKRVLQQHRNITRPSPILQEMAGQHRQETAGEGLQEHKTCTAKTFTLVPTVRCMCFLCSRSRTPWWRYAYWGWEVRLDPREAVRAGTLEPGIWTGSDDVIRKTKSKSYRSPVAGQKRSYLVRPT